VQKSAEVCRDQRSFSNEKVQGKVDFSPSLRPSISLFRLVATPSRAAISVSVDNARAQHFTPKRKLTAMTRKSLPGLELSIQQAKLIKTPCSKRSTFPPLPKEIVGDYAVFPMIRK
jgi:hypothetical protein